MAKKTTSRTSAARGSKPTRSRKRVVKDETIKALLAVRDELLEKASGEDEKETIHMACKGLFACPKHASAAEKTACFDTVKSNLKALGGKVAGISGGGRSRSRKSRKSRSRKSRSRKSRSRK